MGSDATSPQFNATSKVSIRAPAWGATKTSNLMRHEVKFQFALPHGERPMTSFNHQVNIGVSIRAPAWGATHPDAQMRAEGIVSIRAPAWGATAMSRRRCLKSQFQFALPHGERQHYARLMMRRTSFNSRSRMGSDGRNQNDHRPYNVSIRAPAWGATGLLSAVGGRHLVSIRAPAWGATACLTSSPNIRRFQFALPHGERLFLP